MDYKFLALTIAAPFAAEKVKNWFDRRSGAKKAAAVGALPAPAAGESPLGRLPNFSAAQKDRYSEPFGPVRAFKQAVTVQLLTDLEGYSAVPVDVPELRNVGQCWALVPKMPGADTAPELVSRLWKPVVQGTNSSQTIVLASLTLVMPIHATAPKLLIACDVRAANRCAPADGRSPFVVLPPPGSWKAAEQAAEEARKAQAQAQARVQAIQAAAAVKDVEAPSSKPTKKETNGAQKNATATTIEVVESTEAKA